MWKIRELIKTIYKDVPLWAQYIGKTAFFDASCKVESGF